MAASDRRAHEALKQLGLRVRAAREALGHSRASLAARSGLSVRFLAEVEAGRGNISVLRLLSLATALGTTAPLLLGSAEEKRRPFLVLCGLRGAGKSTLGAAVAGELHVPFVEQDRLVEERAGMELREVFSLQGEDWYRIQARAALVELIAQESEPRVIAAAGGVVLDAELWALLRERTHTVWLSARPDDHWRRVVAQGDQRPMRGRPEARIELERLLQRRTPLYAQAAERIDTSRLGEVRARSALRALAERAFSGLVSGSAARGSD